MISLLSLIFILCKMNIPTSHQFMSYIHHALEKTKTAGKIFGLDQIRLDPNQWQVSLQVQHRDTVQKSEGRKLLTEYQRTEIQLRMPQTAETQRGRGVRGGSIVEGAALTCLYHAQTEELADVIKSFLKEEVIQGVVKTVKPHCQTSWSFLPLAACNAAHWILTDCFHRPCHVSQQQPSEKGLRAIEARTSRTTNT